MTDDGPQLAQEGVDEPGHEMVRKVATKDDGTPLINVRIGGPPDNWDQLDIYKDDELEPMKDVVAVDVMNCNLWKLMRDDDGEFMIDTISNKIHLEKVYGNFKIYNKT